MVFYLFFFFHFPERSKQICQSVKTQSRILKSHRIKHPGSYVACQGTQTRAHAQQGGEKGVQQGLCPRASSNALLAGATKAAPAAQGFQELASNNQEMASRLALHFSPGLSSLSLPRASTHCDIFPLWFHTKASRPLGAWV